MQQIYAIEIPRLFQSSPARGGGCNRYGSRRATLQSRVSILTRPWGRVQQRTRVAKDHIRIVSILTRPWGRVQLPNSISIGIPISGFNPHPPVGAGATKYRSPSHMPPISFQSSPARGGGCNLRTTRIRRVKLTPFQSSPARGGGCNWRRCPRRTCRSPCGFNPHPPVEAGATKSLARQMFVLFRSFNPHPPVGAGATTAAPPARCLCR